MKHHNIFLFVALVSVIVLSGCRNGKVQMIVKEEQSSEQESLVETDESGEMISRTKSDEENSSGGILNDEDSKDSGENTSCEKQEKSAFKEQCIYVYVCGHVKCPGVYAVSEQARICDAIALAGGISEDGYGEALSQAEHMKDGDTIYVPGIDEAASDHKIVTNTENDTEDGLVNINTASKEELMTLPGIGESKAETIVQYREEHGAFTSIEGLMEIPGIKEGVYNKIKEKIKIE